MEINKIYNEPCLATLKKMPNNFLDCVITSPPYWQLRDYGYEEQWGLEPTINGYLEHLWEMMDEIKRTLKPEGTCWINLGDTYGTQSGGLKGKTTFDPKNPNATINVIEQPKTIHKCLLLIPHRFAIGCIDRGWIIRNDIIWAKRNAMPESVTDRFSKKHEYFFFMVKQENYFFDLDVIRDRHKTQSLKRYEYDFNGNKEGLDRIQSGARETKVKSKYDTTEIESAHRQGMNKERGQNIVIKRNNLPTQKLFVDFLRKRTTINLIIESTELIKSKVEHWFRYDEAGFSFPSIEDWNTIKHLCDNFDDEFHNIDVLLNEYEIETDDILKNIEKGKNPGDVADFWDIATKPSSSKHYASYNDSLLVKPILAGCPEGGLIYDPFMGTGSTGEVAIRANRKFIGSEMSREYVDLANKRIAPYLDQLTLF
jgi:DNA modification methylase